MVTKERWVTVGCSGSGVQHLVVVHPFAQANASEIRIRILPTRAADSQEILRALSAIKQNRVRLGPARAPAQGPWLGDVPREAPSQRQTERMPTNITSSLLVERPYQVALPSNTSALQ